MFMHVYVGICMHPYTCMMYTYTELYDLYEIQCACVYIYIY